MGLSLRRLQVTELAKVGSLDQKPRRPNPWQYDNIADLFLLFEAHFLAGNGIMVSTAGHRILLFDHHFFHLAAIKTASDSRLFMAEEKETIRATTQGFGKYLVDHGGSRARNLPSAKSAMLEPDEVWENNPKCKAKWVYIKEFDSQPYPYTVALLTTRTEEAGIIVPVSSFPCKRNDIRKWRLGALLYAKQK